MRVTKKYVVTTKKICGTQNRDSCWLNMFSVTQKSNTCWQKIVYFVYKYMLHWLKKFCVAQKVLWCRTKIKVDMHVINFCQNGAPYISAPCIVLFIFASLNMNKLINHQSSIKLSRKEWKVYQDYSKYNSLRKFTTAAQNQKWDRSLSISQDILWDKDAAIKD